MADPNTNAELLDLVVANQIHSRSRSCRRYSNEHCHGQFNLFETVAKTLPKNMPEELRMKVLADRDTSFSNVKNYIDVNLKSKKLNIFDPIKENFFKVQCMSEISL